MFLLHFFLGLVFPLYFQLPCHMKTIAHTKYARSDHIPAWPLARLLSSWKPSPSRTRWWCSWRRISEKDSAQVLLTTRINRKAPKSAYSLILQVLYACSLRSLSPGSLESSLQYCNFLIQHPWEIPRKQHNSLFARNNSHMHHSQKHKQR